MLLAQASDLHLDGGRVAHDRVVSVVNFLRTLQRPPDAVLVTGDVANSGAPTEYAEAADIFSSLSHGRREQGAGTCDARAFERQADDALSFRLSSRSG
jgi:3',5'-cyclic AMP phosphodiesterase CpdA